ncbi:MAG: tetratricopeptide repeat protein [Bryobacteraceae bacterium]
MSELYQRDSLPDSQRFRANRRCSTLAYSLSILMPLTVCYSGDLTPACKSANREASGLLAQERLEDATALLSETLGRLGDSLEDRLCAGATLATLADARLRKGELMAAQKAALASVSRLEEMAGTDSAALRGPLGVLANIAMTQGRFKEASQLISRAEKLPRGSHRDWATVAGLRALLMMHEGRYSAAEEAFRAALAERELAGQQDSPDAAPELWNLGELYLQHGRTDEAVSLFERCLRISEAFPPVPVMQAGSVLGLAMSYAKLNDREMANKSFDRAMHLIDSLPPSTHSSLGMAAYYQYSRFLHRTGQNQRAKAIDKEGERLYGKNWSGMTVGIDSLLTKPRKQ